MVKHRDPGDRLSWKTRVRINRRRTRTEVQDMETAEALQRRVLVAEERFLRTAAVLWPRTHKRDMSPQSISCGINAVGLLLRAAAGHGSGEVQHVAESDSARIAA